MQRKPLVKKKPSNEPLEPQALGKGEYKNYGKPQEAFAISKVPITYRVRDLAQSMGEARRYYIGFVQFAYCQKVKEGFVTILTNGYEGASLKGVLLHSEKELHAYLEKELLG